MDDDTDFERWLRLVIGKNSRDVNIILSNRDSRREHWERQYRIWCEQHERQFQVQYKPYRPKTKSQIRNDEFAAWFRDLYGAHPTPADFANKAHWAAFTRGENRKPTTEQLYAYLRNSEGFTNGQAYAIFKNPERLELYRDRFKRHSQYEWTKQYVDPDGNATFTTFGTRTGRIPSTEGPSIMTMTRAELLALQEAAAQQMAQAQEQLSKYSKFPTEEEVLALGDVIRFTVARVSKPPKVRTQARLQTEYGSYGLPDFGDVLTELIGAKMDVTVHTYDYVALYVPDLKQWFTTGSRGRDKYEYDELLKFLVDAGVKSFEVYDDSAKTFGEQPESTKTDEIDTALKHVSKAREAVADATAEDDRPRTRKP